MLCLLPRSCPHSAFGAAGTATQRMPCDLVNPVTNHPPQVPSGPARSFPSMGPSSWTTSTCSTTCTKPALGTKTSLRKPSTITPSQFLRLDPAPSLPFGSQAARSARGLSLPRVAPHVLRYHWTSPLTAVAAPAQPTVPASKNFSAPVLKESCDVMLLTRSRSTSAPPHATTRSRRPGGPAFATRPNQGSMGSLS